MRLDQVGRDAVRLVAVPVGGLDADEFDAGRPLEDFRRARGSPFALPRADDSLDDGDLALPDRGRHVAGGHPPLFREVHRQTAVDAAPGLFEGVHVDAGAEVDDGDSGLVGPHDGGDQVIGLDGREDDRGVLLDDHRVQRLELRLLVPFRGGREHLDGDAVFLRRRLVGRLHADPVGVRQRDDERPDPLVPVELRHVADLREERLLDLQDLRVRLFLR